jgi:hypothetical protein
LKRKRGCGKNAAHRYKQEGAPVRWGAPLLSGDPLLYECPTGLAIRESPWVYDVIDATNRVDACSPREWSGLPLWFRHAARLITSERDRLRREDRNQEEAARRGKRGR